MSHDHEHPHEHPHEPAGPLPEHLDLDVPDSELSPSGLGRRSFLRRAGLLGAAAAGSNVLGGALRPGVAAADDGREEDEKRSEGVDPRGLLWLAGDHHIHTRYSPDAQYLVSQQVDAATRFGLDWMVITDHGNAGHAKIGVDLVHPDIVQSRIDNARTLVFQGVEWNIPSAEHGTVFVAPGENDVTVLKAFEQAYDGTVNGTVSQSDAHEQEALKGLVFLRDKVADGSVADALMLANHPARKGLDSPHEIRNWRDTAPTIAVGMEGAPGHQAAAIPGPGHETNGRGFYDNKQSPDSFATYPYPDSYVTYGGFDWMTSTVGGLWDSLLAEGKPWWISANSDSHQVYSDTFKPGSQSQATTGSRGAPVDTGSPIYTYGDFFPGYYSNTVVGATSFSYRAVMEAIRAGRMYVVHGGLVGAMSVRLVGGGAAPVTLGGTSMPNRGRDLELQVDIALADRPNYHGDVPKLAKVDLIMGAVTGPLGAAARDTFAAPGTRVVESFEVRDGGTGTYSLRYRIKAGKEPFYLRLRGSDGKRLATGLNGAAVDPAGPKVDALGNADPWQDLWFYTNPIFVLPKR